MKKLFIKFKNIGCDREYEKPLYSSCHENLPTISLFLLNHFEKSAFTILTMAERD